MKISHFAAALAGFKAGIAMAHNEHLRKHPDVDVQDASIVHEVAAASDVQGNPGEVQGDLRKNGGALAKGNLSEGDYAMTQGPYSTPICGKGGLFSWDQCYCCDGTCQSECCLDRSLDDWQSCKDPQCPMLVCGLPPVFGVTYSVCAESSDTLCREIGEKCANKNDQICQDMGLAPTQQPTGAACSDNSDCAQDGASYCCNTNTKTCMVKDTTCHVGKCDCSGFDCTPVRRGDRINYHCLLLCSDDSNCGQGEVSRKPIEFVMFAVKHTSLGNTLDQTCVDRLGVKRCVEVSGADDALIL